MKTRRRKRLTAPGDTLVIDSTTTIFSSDLLTPDEERELLAGFFNHAHLGVQL